MIHIRPMHCVEQRPMLIRHTVLWCTGRWPCVRDSSKYNYPQENPNPQLGVISRATLHDGHNAMECDSGDDDNDDCNKSIRCRCTDSTATQKQSQSHGTTTEPPNHRTTTRIGSSSLVKICTAPNCLCLYDECLCEKRFVYSAYAVYVECECIIRVCRMCMYEKVFVQHASCAPLWAERSGWNMWN